jgi:hypothetical protein
MAGTVGPFPDLFTADWRGIGGTDIFAIINNCGDSDRPAGVAKHF